jgi:hypothetical protein
MCKAASECAFDVDPTDLAINQPAWEERLPLIFEVVRVWAGRPLRVVAAAANANIADRLCRALNRTPDGAPYHYETREVTR